MSDNCFNSIKFYPVKKENHKNLVDKCKEKFKTKFIGSYCLNESVYIQLYPNCFEILQKDDSICTKLAEPFGINFDFSENTVEYFMSDLLEIPPKANSTIENSEDIFNSNYLESYSKSNIDSILSKFTSQIQENEEKKDQSLEPANNNNPMNEAASENDHEKNEIGLTKEDKNTETINQINNLPKKTIIIIKPEEISKNLLLHDEDLSMFIKGNKASKRKKLNVTQEFFISYLKGNLFIYVVVCLSIILYLFSLNY